MGKPKQTPKLKYPRCLAGSYQGPVLAEDAILQELFYGIKIIPGKKRRKPQKNKTTWNDQKPHMPCKSLWLVALEMPSEIGQS
jgi:hypothetical protein